ncbi:MAG: glycosyltransferase family 4 protein [Acidobacteria bacterium]|nr:glycosyltransferase family 4 protein [Acidobacteriota bacterium]MCL5287449.1 glycosyltransferase family 4 protein [Acidobacteriota bacterium]
MRIAVVTQELHRSGGTERGTAEVVARLAQEHQICLFAHRWDRENNSNICFHRVPVMPWPGLLRFLSFYWMASRAVDTAARRHGGFDVIYSPGPNCRQVEVCTAWFCQARQDELLRSGKLRPAAGSVSDWLRLLHRKIYAATVTRLERKFYKSPKLRSVVSPAQVLKDDLVASYGIEPERIVVAHAGVDPESFSVAQREALRAQARAELKLREGEFWFLFAGTDWVRKGMLTVHAALREAPQARLLAVGPYDPASWKRHAERAGIAGRIRYLLPRRDIIFYFAAADALLAPSVFEPFGLIPLEAMACGLPVIITPPMGVAEIATPEDAVILHRADNAAELAAAMRRVMEDSALREKLARNAPARARMHPWDAIFRATETELLAVARKKHLAADKRR